MEANLLMNALVGAALAATPAAVQQPTSVLGPEATAAAACVGAAEEKAALTAEKAGLERTIGDIAMGKGPKKKRKVSGGDVARGVAGTAASILLPFPLGAALNAGAGAVAKGGGKKAAAPVEAGPDVSGMIDRLSGIDARLKRLSTCG